MNLLFTSAGRRGYLLDYFRAALEGRGTLHALNSDARAPAFLHADVSVVGPRIHAPGYVDFLLNYCVCNEIDAVIPLFDLDVPVLARAHSRFEAASVRLVSSSERVAEIANDKRATIGFLREHGFGMPLSFFSLDEALRALAEGRLAYPLVLKPRWGMGSIGVFVAEDELELRVFYRKVRDEVERSYLMHESAADMQRCVLIQQRLLGEEYGLDVVNDLQGRYVVSFVKRKLTMRAGETDAAVTVDDHPLAQFGARLSAALGHIGNLDVDVIKDASGIHVLDVNARFGGGYPFSHLAGADIPRAIVAWLRGLEPDPAWFRLQPGVLSIKDMAVRRCSLSPEHVLTEADGK